MNFIINEPDPSAPFGPNHGHTMRVRSIRDFGVTFIMNDVTHFITFEKIFIIQFQKNLSICHKHWNSFDKSVSSKNYHRLKTYAQINKINYEMK